MYCKRKTCDNCPLPFNDRKTLRQYLKDTHINTESFWFLKSDLKSGAIEDEFKARRKRSFNANEA